MKILDKQKDEEYAKKLGKRIRELRKEKGMSQKELGEALFSGQDTISLWELGKRLPDVMAVVEMCRIFEVSADYILGLEKD